MAGNTASKPHERRTIMVNLTLTSIVSFLVFFVLYNFAAIPVPPLPTLVDRLVYTLRLQSFSCLCVIVAISIVALSRLCTIAVDPINGNGEYLVAFRVRFLTNTLEQFVISFVGQLILTTYLKEGQMKVIPILVSFFVIGRILFYIGYSQSYMKRTFGFVSTFGVTFVVWAFVMYFVITDFIF